MTAYSATFSDGVKKTLKNSRADYAAAWRFTCQEEGRGIIGSDGFSRDRATAEKTMRSEISRMTKADRWTPKGRKLLFSEIVEVVRG